VKIDSDLVKQAVLNVMINGMQAMGGGGNLTVGARAVDGEAQVEIKDEGGGIPMEIREKIFNLYFTTKSGGSGIGLPMSYRVMQLHGGSMEFDSVEGEGTTFRMHFPLSETIREVGTGVSAAVNEGERQKSIVSAEPDVRS
jgi:signal transduction histidine kinase